MNNVNQYYESDLEFWLCYNKPDMLGTLAQYEGMLLGILFAWEAMSGNNRKIIKTLWKEECLKLHGKINMTLCDIAINDIELNRRGRIWPIASEYVSFMMGYLHNNVFEYYNDNKAYIPIDKERMHEVMNILHVSSDRNDVSYIDYPPDVYEKLLLLKLIMYEKYILNNKSMTGVVNMLYSVACYGSAKRLNVTLSESICESENSYIRKQPENGICERRKYIIDVFRRIVSKYKIMMMGH